MIPLIVFYLHVVFVATLFTKRWQEEGTTEGILAVLFSGLIFFVGWSMSSFIVKLLSPDGTVLGIDRDSASLLFLTAAEAVFYRFYLRGDRRQKGNAGSPASGDQVSGADTPP